MERAVAQRRPSGGNLTLAAAGGAIVAAFASSRCCLGPLLFAAVGLGGAGALASFEAYRPHLAALTLALLGAGFYFTYRRRPRPQAAVGPAGCHCELPRRKRFGRLALWIAAILVALLLAFPHLEGLLLA